MTALFFLSLLSCISKHVLTEIVMGRYNDSLRFSGGPIADDKALRKSTVTVLYLLTCARVCSGQFNEATDDVSHALEFLKDTYVDDLDGYDGDSVQYVVAVLRERYPCNASSANRRAVHRRPARNDSTPTQRNNNNNNITEDTRETTFLFQRLSMALQRGNAVSFHNTVVTE